MLDLLTFKDARKSRRDKAGLWRVGVGLSVLAWLAVAQVLAAILQFADR